MRKSVNFIISFTKQNLFWYCHLKIIYFSQQSSVIKMCLDGDVNPKHGNLGYWYIHKISK